MSRDEFKCRQCGHEFGRLPGVKDVDLCCPRCGGASLERNRYLFGKESAEGLVDDDYFDVALAPCCNLRYVGRHPSPAAPECADESCAGRGDDGGEGKSRKG